MAPVYLVRISLSALFRRWCRLSRASNAWLGSAFVALPLMLASTAGAQTSSAAARALFIEARSLMKAKQYSLACPKLEESLRLDMGMGTQFNLAHCWEKLGKTASAWALFLDVAAAARATGQDRRESAARARAKALTTGLSKLKVKLAQSVPGQIVTRNGMAVGSAAWGTSAPVDPGSYQFRSAAPGYQDWSTQVEIVAGDLPQTIVIPPLKRNSGSHTELSVPASERSRGLFENAQPLQSDMMESDSGLQRTSGLATLGLGVAAGATGLVFTLMSNSHTAAAKKLCTGQLANGERNGCVSGSTKALRDAESNDQKRFQTDAKAYRDYSYYSFGVSGAALLVGAVLVLTADTNAPPEDVAWTLAPWLNFDGSSGARLHLRF